MKKIKKYFSCLFSTVLLVLIWAEFASAGAIVVVVNKDNNISKLSKRSLERIYKGKRAKWQNGAPVKIIVPAPGSREMQALLSAIGVSSEDALAKLHLKLVYQQKLSGEPPKMSSEEAVQAVAKDKGAIAVVDSDKASGNVKVIEVEGLN